MSDRLLELVPDAIRHLNAPSVSRPERVRARLDTNESPFSLPADLMEALSDELEKIQLNRYPRPDAPELRQVVAERVGVPGDSLVFGNGSDELIALLIATFSKPRSEGGRPGVMYPVPSFAVYRMASACAGAETMEVPLTDEFELDDAALGRALAERRPNVVFFALPNNPTGTLWSTEIVLRVARDNPDVVVVSDEAYADYGAGTLAPHVRELPNLVVMRTLSKIGLAALRVGYLSAAPAVVHELEKVRHPYNVGTLNQKAAAWILAEHGNLLRRHCEQVAAERDALAARMAELPGVRVFPSKANVLLFRIGEPGEGRADEVWRALADRGVLVRHFRRDGALADCLRVSIGTPEENRLFVDELEDVLG